MSHRALGLFLLAGLPFSGITHAQDKPQPIPVAERITVNRATVNGQPVFWFNDLGRIYAISLNTKIPKAEALKKSIPESLGKNKEFRDKLVFGAYEFGGQPLDLVEVYIGPKVPSEVVQVVLDELGKLSDLKLALSIEDEEGLNMYTHRISIGAVQKSGKKPITQEKLKALIDPKLSHAELINKIRNEK